MQIDRGWTEKAVGAVRALERVYGEHDSIHGSHEGDSCGHVEVDWPSCYGEAVNYVIINCRIGHESEHAAALRAALATPQEEPPRKWCPTCCHAVGSTCEVEAVRRRPFTSGEEECLNWKWSRGQRYGPDGKPAPTCRNCGWSKDGEDGSWGMDVVCYVEPQIINCRTREWRPCRFWKARS